MGTTPNTTRELGGVQTHQRPQQQPGTSCCSRRESHQKETTMTRTTPEHHGWDRFQKLEFLLETTTQQFQDTLLDQIVSSMTEHEFSETYEYITRMHGLPRDSQELEQMAQIPE